MPPLNSIFIVFKQNDEAKLRRNIAALNSRCKQAYTCSILVYLIPFFYSAIPSLRFPCLLLSPPPFLSVSARVSRTPLPFVNEQNDNYLKHN